VPASAMVAPPRRRLTALAGTEAPGRPARLPGRLRHRTRTARRDSPHRRYR
jgi:hypothetical protein